MKPLRRAAIIFIVLQSWIVLRAQNAAPSLPVVQYEISLARRSAHFAHVRTRLPASGNIEVQLPVWNALYQVRDFSQYIRNVKASDAQGRALPVRKIEKSSWRIVGGSDGVVIEYDVFANLGGPYGAQLNDEHAFFNLAEILMYAPTQRAAPVRVTFSDIPELWHIATALTTDGEGSTVFRARNYDELVDSPVEIGRFQETSFHLNGAEYRIAVHANLADYKLENIQQMVQKIVSAEVVWMNDRPFQSYLFIYHFPHQRSDGGMEHSYSTAIDENVERIKADPLSLAEVTAHEFFHLWNVKRIRPQSLEPVDYMRENYTTALWFSEGVTSTVEQYMLLRAGISDEKIYLRHLAEQIRILQSRPAHLTQSAEESSLDAWLEKYPHYRLPDRSISYYDKGEVLGVLLDLKMREASHGRASLRDVMQWMNQHYAKAGKFFPDSAGVEQGAEAVSGGHLDEFFREYVAGTREIAYNDFFQTVGLNLARRVVTVGDPGFTAVQNFHAAPIIGEVEPGSAAQQAGLEEGDTVLALNDRLAPMNVQAQLDALEPGTTVKVKILGPTGERELEWKVGFKEEQYFTFEEVAHATPGQRARRAAWLAAEDEPEPARAAEMQSAPQP